MYPPWSQYSRDLPLAEQEEVETFWWMRRDDAPYFEDFRQALDKVEGARDYLRAGGKDILGDEMIDKISGHLRQDHSGGTLSALVRSYCHALKDWPTWVLNQKTSMAYDRYKMLQLPFQNIYELVLLIARIEGGGLPGSDFAANHAAFVALKNKYQIPGTNDEAMAYAKAVYDELR